MNAIDNVVTAHEVAEILGYTHGYIRMMISKNKFNNKKYRKSGAVTLFDKQYILKFKKEIDQVKKK